MVQLTDEQMNQYKEQILIDRLMGKVPSFSVNPLTGVSNHPTQHIKYLKELIGRKKFNSLDWVTKFKLIDYLTE